MVAKHHDGRWTKVISNWNPAISTTQKGGAGSKEDQHRDGKTTSIFTYMPSPQIRERSHERHDWLSAAQDGLKWNDSQTNNSRRNSTHTTKAHDHDEGGNSDDDDESLLILSQPIES